MTYGGISWQVPTFENNFLHLVEKQPSIFEGTNIKVPVEINGKDKSIKRAKPVDVVEVGEGYNETYNYALTDGDKIKFSPKRAYIALAFDNYEDAFKTQMTSEQIITTFGEEASRAVRRFLDKKAIACIGATIIKENKNGTTSNVNLQQDGGTLITASTGMTEQVIADSKAALYQKEQLNTSLAVDGSVLFCSQVEKEQISLINSYKNREYNPMADARLSNNAIDLINGTLIKQTSGNRSGQSVVASNRIILPEDQTASTRKVYISAPNSIAEMPHGIDLKIYNPDELRRIYTDGNLTTSTNAGYFLDSFALVLIVKYAYLRLNGAKFVEITTTIG